ncbi:MAG: GAF domain-containing protein [Kiritimatiellaeota bacterium]|nr:GAF domain-containing protein [Kiritimatiellota bacterium]
MAFPHAPSGPAEADFAKHRAENAAKMLNLASALTAVTDPAELLRIILDAAENVMDAEAASLLLLDKTTRRLSFVAATGPAGESIRDKTIAPGQGIAGWVARTGTYLISNDPYNDPRFDPSFDRATGFKTCSYLCMPLRAPEGGRTVGVFLILNKRTGPFNEWDVQVFSALCNLVTVALRNIPLKRLTDAGRDIARANGDRGAGEQFSHYFSEALHPPLPTDTGPYLFSLACRPAAAGPGELFYDAGVLSDGRAMAYVGRFRQTRPHSAAILDRLATHVHALIEGTFDTSQALGRLNRYLFNRWKGSLAIAFQGAVFGKNGTDCTLLGAGGETPMVLTSKGVERIAPEPTVPLGAAPAGRWAVHSREIEPGIGSVLLACGSGTTGGLPEGIAESATASPDPECDMFDAWQLSAGETHGELLLLSVRNRGAKGGLHAVTEKFFLPARSEAESLKQAAVEICAETGLEERDRLVWAAAVVRAFLELIATEAEAEETESSGLKVRLRRSPRHVCATLYGPPTSEADVETTDAADTLRNALAALRSHVDGAELLPCAGTVKVRLIKRTPDRMDPSSS